MASSSCPVCGSNQSKVVDGLMYCEICGTHLFDYREVEEDEDQVVAGIGRIKTKRVKQVQDKSMAKTDFVALGMATAQTAKPKKRKGDDLHQLSLSTSTIVGEGIKASRQRKDIGSGREHAPSYLRRVGTRLAAFTKILAKCVAWIRRDPTIPESFTDHTFAIYQRYLSACGVAFTPKDYTDNLETMFRALVLNKNIAFEKAREKKAKKERRKKKGKEALQKSVAAWDLLIGDTLDENLELRSDVDSEDEEQQEEETTVIAPTKKPQLVTVVDTTIPKEVLENASTIYLGMDVAVAILYVSIITIGCRWIVISDIVRWIREDRMGITLFQRMLLECGGAEGMKQSKCGSFSNMDLPLYEFQRTALFVWQICNLPQTPAKIDFKQIIARCLHHLNLPEAMFERVMILMKLAPPCKHLDEENLRRQGRIEQGPYVNGFSVPGTRKFGALQMLFAFGRHIRHRSTTSADIFFSTETKIFALILMALKLSFGLDDEREVALSREAAKRMNAFNFMEWFYQLKMRMMFWEGYSPLDVLQTWKPVQPLHYENEFPRGENVHFYVHANHNGKPAYCIRHYPRDSGFTNCIPRTMRLDSSTSLPNPFPEDTHDALSNRNDENALYAPLQSQTNVLREFLGRRRTEDERQRIRVVVDEEAVKVFKASYEDCELAEGALEGVSEGDSSPTWFSKFPCANDYKRYPRPNWTNGGVIHLKENDDRLRRLNKRMGLHTENSGLRMIFASRKAATDAWRLAQAEMSQTFLALIEWSSKIIGESQAVLYAAFLMVEMQVVDGENFEKLKEYMVDGRIHPIKTTTLHKDGHRSFKTHYISAAEDVSEAHEVDIVRIGLPRNWASGINEANPENCEELKYTSDSTISDEYSSESDDSITEESDVSERRTQVKSRGSSRTEMETTDISSALEPSELPPPKREPLDAQSDILSYDFDTIWRLVTMRYW
ncbi:unnamed protein product [Cylicocyclus nassatus]|uniref:Rrn7/TAF1B C-terminal cyclin domain-containing protein n=1 Tax=Cylicocyclus nassatus TaxID=53992 RepID=A0AA36GPZ9_CYLNA|nr:unnamed protein product [Cylicocyclus nassatus]